MITENSPNLGTFAVRDISSVTLDVRRRGDGLDIEVTESLRKAAYVVLSPADRIEFVKWLAAQLSDEERAELKATL